ncbi:hypothetical protein SS50377_26442 [Spironucleus salmonicida]|uniref:Uncharacterized protein n=1 Tax=Spironucleus salmonicida TaxID=348837 RepID=V6LA97_9EUKA|nr:hypothetical protein SS50377_26442 [Spironucleus salmonicida]|eukprot:EST41302.1 Hypothetical protein SS50377_fx008 [Spironucleus salmonicida]
MQPQILVAKQLALQLQDVTLLSPSEKQQHFPYFYSFIEKNINQSMFLSTLGPQKSQNLQKPKKIQRQEFQTYINWFNEDELQL